jgi:hypothetical protein
VAFALIAVQRGEQSRGVLIARHRQLGLQLDAQRLGGGGGGHPFRQRALRELGWVVDDPSSRGPVAVRCLGADQPGPLELLEHRVEPLGLDLPGRAEAAVEAVGKVVAVTRALQQQAEQSAF